jgi:hypothetical protein
VPDNALISFSVSLLDGANKILRKTVNYTRAMAQGKGGVVTSVDGKLELMVPAGTLLHDSFVDIGLVQQQTEALRNADQAFDHLFQNQQTVAGPYLITARIATGALESELNPHAQPVTLSYNEALKDVPPQQRADFVLQPQEFVQDKENWRPLGTGTRPLGASAGPLGTRSVSVPINKLGVYRINAFAVPGPGVTDLFNFPNPFSPEEGGTDIHYMLGDNSEVHLLIYDLLGNLVRRIDIGAGDNGGRLAQNIFHWDGRNGNGTMVANGGYILQIFAQDSQGNTSRVHHKLGVAK